jgi:hypothetical protein
MKHLRYPLACVLSAWLAVITARADQPVAADAPREIAILHIRVLSGEDSVQPAGSVSKQPIVVLITDETGQPVQGATVSFRLPTAAPGGVFSSGLRSEVITTGSDGRAVLFGVTWDRTPGAVQIRVTAVKDSVRAGTIISLNLIESAAAGKAFSPAGRTRAAKSGAKSKWAVLAIVAGAAAGGLAAGLSRGGEKTAAAPPAPSVQIGPPSISIGRP